MSKRGCPGLDGRKSLKVSLMLLQCSVVVTAHRCGRRKLSQSACVCACVTACVRVCIRERERDSTKSLK